MWAPFLWRRYFGLVVGGFWGCWTSPQLGCLCSCDRKGRKWGKIKHVSGAQCNVVQLSPAGPHLGSERWHNRLKLQAFLGNRALKTTDQVKNLGLIIDEDISYNFRNYNEAKVPFIYLKDIARIRGMHTFIPSWLVCCNCLLASSPRMSIKQLHLRHSHICCGLS